MPRSFIYVMRLQHPGGVWDAPPVATYLRGPNMTLFESCLMYVPAATSALFCACLVCVRVCTYICRCGFTLSGNKMQQHCSTTCAGHFGTLFSKTSSVRRRLQRLSMLSRASLRQRRNRIAVVLLVMMQGQSPMEWNSTIRWSTPSCEVSCRQTSRTWWGPTLMKARNS